MATDTKAVIQNEAQVVENWRIKQFHDQGFNVVQIADLLVSGVDQHDTEKLLAKGCEHKLALEILRG